MQDMTFDVDSGILWGELYALVVAELAVASAEYGYQYTVEPLAIYQAEEAQNKRYSIRITLAHHQKTLKTSEVNALLEKIAKAVHEEYRATRV
jgi:phenylalanyl-tRNA synthetase beta subunit